VWQWALIAGAGGVLLATGVPGGHIFGGFDNIWMLALTTSLITSMIMLSYVVLTGYIGQISLAQMSMAGVAAFVTARLMANGIASAVQPFPVRGLNWPWPPAAIGGILAAILVGVLVGLPAVRIRGVQLAVVTMAAAVMLQSQYFENDSWTDLKAGSNAVVKDPTFFGHDIGSVGKGGLTDNPRFAVFCVIVLALLCVVVSNLRRSGTGRRFLAVRANERAAAAAGIEVPRTKLLAFAIAAAIAGVGGVMTGFQQRQISSSSWVFFASLATLAFAYLGGITSVNGAIIGGIIASNGLVAAFGNYHNPGFTKYVYMLGGVGMVLTAILQPSGQAPFWQPGVQYFARWVSSGPRSKFVPAIARVVPGIVPGAAAVMLLVWTKAREFRNWHLLMALAAGLLTRSIGMEILHGVTKKGNPSPLGAPTPESGSQDTTPANELAEV
jgi:ABC-type branched-subunit amino acid transport system permease subunit